MSVVMSAAVTLENIPNRKRQMFFVFALSLTVVRLDGLCDCKSKTISLVLFQLWLPVQWSERKKIDPMYESVFFSAACLGCYVVT